MRGPCLLFVVVAVVVVVVVFVVSLIWEYFTHNKSELTDLPCNENDLTYFPCNKGTSWTNRILNESELTDLPCKKRNLMEIRQPYERNGFSRELQSPTPGFSQSVITLWLNYKSKVRNLDIKWPNLICCGVTGDLRNLRAFGKLKT